MGLIEKVVRYVVDSNFKRSVDLRKWFDSACDELDKKYDLAKAAGIHLKDKNKEKCRKAWSFVRQNMRYYGDMKLWNAYEKWQTPLETWTLFYKEEKNKLVKSTQGEPNTFRAGDCEDGALLIMAILRQAKVPEWQYRIVAGDVLGGGHAYVVWLSDEDLTEYTLDWCYWPEDTFKRSYFQNVNYFLGGKEWFSFNTEKSFTQR